MGTGGPFSPPYRRMALHPIPRVVDNTDAMAIEQHAINISHTPIRRADMPSGPGSLTGQRNQTPCLVTVR